MMRNTLFGGAAFALLIFFVVTSHSIDFNSLDDQDTFRCSGGVVALGDLDRDVREKCGNPLKIGRKQDFGPIWIYYEDQANFMYYLEFLNGKLQRIMAAPCSPEDANCLDLR